MMNNTILRMTLTTCLTFFVLARCVDADDLAFSYHKVADVGGRTAIGDIDGDGKNDIVVHSWSSHPGIDDDGFLTWYQYPDWKQIYILRNDHLFGDGVVITDLDGDGDNDLVTSKGNDGIAEVWWFENSGQPEIPNWKQHKIATAEIGSEMKDVEVHDMDHDGKLDVVVRTKHFVTIDFQETPLRWIEHKMKNRQREGMMLADVDGDGDLDCHSLRVADMDLDGDADVVAASLKRTNQPRIVVFLNLCDGKKWKTVLVANKGGYKAKLADIDNDGDLDILTALSWEDPPIQLFRNLTR